MTSLSLSLQGSIQQLVLTADPTAPNEQCEEDEPYVSVLCRHICADVLYDCGLLNRQKTLYVKYNI